MDHTNNLPPPPSNTRMAMAGITILAILSLTAAVCYLLFDHFTKPQWEVLDQQKERLQQAKDDFTQDTADGQPPEVICVRDENTGLVWPTQVRRGMAPPLVEPSMFNHRPQDYCNRPQPSTNTSGP